jgi:anti-sigma regulatory factor (Ser/Thr protein kinase)
MGTSLAQISGYSSPSSSTETTSCGSGFDPSRVQDPLAPENLLRESGRGVFYMRNFMDEVRFTTAESGGTRIELTKRLSKGGRNEESGT